jgi:hypothetical protein
MGKKDVHMTLKPMQRRILLESPSLSLEGGTDATVKSRQVGNTTVLLCLTIALMVLYPGVEIAWVAPAKVLPKLRKKWRIIRAAVMGSASSGWPGAGEIDNADELELANGSRVQWIDCGGTVKTATDAGVSDTIHLGILSEVCIWEHADITLRALEPALEHGGCSFFMDSTPPVEPGKGQDYLDICKAAWKGESEVRLHPWYWFTEPAYRKTRPAAPPYTEDEQSLIDRGVDPFQLQWRRDKLADGKKWPIGKFLRAYVETVPKALRPFGAIIEEWLELIDHLERLRESGGFPPYATGHDLRDVIPEALQSDEKRDPFFRKGLVRMWSAPRPGRRYRVAVDSSGGTAKSDWQVAVVIDQDGEHVCTARMKVPVLIFAGVVQRLMAWYNDAFLNLETEKWGTLVYDHLISAISPEEAALRGAHPIVCTRVPETQIKKRNANKATKAARISAFRDWLPITVIKDPDILDEMITLDPATYQKRNKDTDTDDYLDALGIGWDEHTRDHHEEVTHQPLVAIRRRR